MPPMTSTPEPLGLTSATTYRETAGPDRGDRWHVWPGGRVEYQTTAGVRRASLIPAATLAGGRSWTVAEK